DYHRFRRLGLDAPAVDRAAQGARDFPGFVRRLYDELAAQRRKPLAGDKTPGYVRHLPLLAALFPEARIVHLIRDGRDVALSALEWATPSKGPGRLPLWSEDPIAVCALWWRERVEAGRREGRSLGPDRYLEVRYEDLVAEPERELARVTCFLGLDAAPEMLAFNRGKVRLEPALSAKKAWRSPMPGLRDWRRQMDPASAELFEVLAGETLEASGYPTRGALPCSRAVRARARRARRELGETVVSYA
ncbi:MAG TPA: sulfotransferase, partial [Planctomycetota bacterium]|nr:sulfotransferase [Planctomycetota bacterium]